MKRAFDEGAARTRMRTRSQIRNTGEEVAIDLAGQ